MDRKVIKGIANPGDINDNFEYLFSTLAQVFGTIVYKEAVELYANLPLSPSEGDAYYVKADYIIYRWSEGVWVEILDHTFLNDFAGFISRGTYSAGTTYAKYNIVSYGTPASSYISLADSNTGNTPNTSPLSWDILSAGGAIGFTGSIGYTGSQGGLGYHGSFGYTGSQGLPGEGSGMVNTTGATPVISENFVSYNGTDGFGIKDSGFSGASYYAKIADGFTIIDNGNIGTSKTIDWSTGPYQRVAMNQSGGLTFTDPFSGSTRACALTLILDFAGAFTPTMPAVVKAAPNIAPVSRSSGTTEIHTFIYRNGSYYQSRISGFST